MTNPDAAPTSIVSTDESVGSTAPGGVSPPPAAWPSPAWRATPTQVAPAQPGAAGPAWRSASGWPPLGSPTAPHVPQLAQIPPAYLPPPRRERSRAFGILVAAIVATLVASIGFAATQARRAADGTGSLGNVLPDLTPASPAELTLNHVLSSQSAALLDGDESAFLAIVDPAKKDTVSAYRRLYANLRALHVAAWRQEADEGNNPVRTETTVTIDVAYCFLVANCNQTSAEFDVTVDVVDGNTRIESFVPPAKSAYEDEPLPWEATALTVVTGPRVIVAASPAEKSQLSRALPIAERAAVAADKYAHWGSPPVYVVYLAGPQDSKLWFGGALADTLGEAVPLSEYDTEVMVVLPDAAETQFAGPGGLAAVIQHEMGHVATLYEDRQYSDDDTLVEGIADYISYTGHSTWATYALEDVHDYLKRGKWSGSCLLTKEITSTDGLTASAAYGIGYLTIKRLVTKYGTAKMLDFWGDVERNGMTPQNAATADLGASWQTVNSDCARYVHATVHA